MLAQSGILRKWENEKIIDRRFPVFLIKIQYIDEIEKGLAGAGGSGDNDSGTTMRVFGTILTWLNEVEKPVFVVATANHLDKLPPELKCLMHTSYLRVF